MTDNLEKAWAAAKNQEDYLPFLKQLHLSQLQEIEQQRSLGVNNVRIVSVGPGGRMCSYCSSNDEKILNLDKELMTQTLPHSKCSCTAYDDNQTGFCLCYYEMVFDDEI